MGAIRKIVIGQRATTQPGIQQVAVWFRLPVPVARQPYYASLQGGAQPSAPGDYAGADSAEKPALQTGTVVERTFFDIIDPTSTAAQIEARLQNLYSAASAAVTSSDDAALQNWASFWDGTIWTLKSS